MKLHKWSDIKKGNLLDADVRRLDQEISEEVMEMNLRQLRDMAGLTQVELAAKLESAQPQLSQIENQSDHRVSTLRKYVRARGGELKIHAVLNGKTVELVV